MYPDTACAFRVDNCSPASWKKALTQLAAGMKHVGGADTDHAVVVVGHALQAELAVANHGLKVGHQGLEGGQVAG